LAGESSLCGQSGAVGNVLIEDDSFRRQPIQVRRLHPIIAVTAEIAEVEAVDVEEKNFHVVVLRSPREQSVQTPGQRLFPVPDYRRCSNKQPERLSLQDMISEASGRPQAHREKRTISSITINAIPSQRAVRNPRHRRKSPRPRRDETPRAGIGRMGGIRAPPGLSNHNSTLCPRVVRPSGKPFGS
jgi:hypothetical protein